jgi:hypothetical protein
MADAARKLLSPNEASWKVVLGAKRPNSTPKVAHSSLSVAPCAVASGADEAARRATDAATRTPLNLDSITPPS